MTVSYPCMKSFRQINIRNSIKTLTLPYIIIKVQRCRISHRVIKLNNSENSTCEKVEFSLIIQNTIDKQGVKEVKPWALKSDIWKIRTGSRFSI